MCRAGFCKRHKVRHTTTVLRLRGTHSDESWRAHLNQCRLHTDDSLQMCLCIFAGSNSGVAAAIMVVMVRPLCSYVLCQWSSPAPPAASCNTGQAGALHTKAAAGKADVNDLILCENVLEFQSVLCAQKQMGHLHKPHLHFRIRVMGSESRTAGVIKSIDLG